MDKNEEGKNLRLVWLVLPLLLLFGLTIKYCSNSNKEKALKNSNKTWAIVTQRVHCGKGCLIRYRFLDDKDHEFSSKYGGKQIQECHENLIEGDTIFIKYSLSDPEITEMIHCYWNEEIREEWLKNKR